MPLDGAPLACKPDRASHDFPAMNNPLTEAMRRAGFASLDALARALKDHAPEAFAGIEPRSLGAKLSNLGRGMVTWWRDRPDRVEAVAALTGFDALEVIAAQRSRDRGRWSFPEFPTLPPLDLSAEATAEIGAGHPVDNDQYKDRLDGWMHRAMPLRHQSPRLMPLRGIAWLTVPPHCGRSLLLAQLRANANIEVIDADTLDEAVRLASGTQPVVLAPRGPVEQPDLEALVHLDPERAALIVSACAYPGHVLPFEAAWHPTWDWLVANADGRRRLDLVRGSQAGVFGFGDIEVFEWRLAEGWRRNLIEWLERRLAATGDTLFTRQGLDSWLQGFDPQAIWFATPSDVLALASLCHSSGERKLPKPDSPEAGARLLLQLAARDTRATSLLRRLVELRWRDARHDWMAALPWDSWLAIIDAESLGAEVGERPRPSKKRPVLLDLEALRQEGLLVVNRQGWWEFSQPVQARLLLRDSLMRWVSEGSIAHWARPIMGDAFRERTLDAVLDAMSPEKLDPSIRAVLNEPAGSLSALSAAEALIVALGVKYASGSVVCQQSHLGLLMRVLEQYEAMGGAVSPPFTRIAVDGFSPALSWTLACWEWSLASLAPAAVPDELGVLFPGWQSRGEVAKNWYAQLPLRLRELPAILAPEPDGSLRAMRSAQRVVDRLGLEALQEWDPLCPLNAALLLVAAGQGQLDAKPEWWPALLRWRGAECHLLEALEEIDPNAVAANLLPSLLSAMSGSDATAAVLSPVWTSLLGKSSAVVVIPLLPMAAIMAMYGRFRGLPSSWQRGLAHRLGPHDPIECWEVVLRHSAVPEELAERLLRDPLGGAIASKLWHWAPTTCLAHARDPESMWGWLLILNCPDEHIGPLAEAIAGCEELLPGRADRLAWVLSRLRSVRGQEHGLRALIGQLGLR